MADIITIMIKHVNEYVKWFFVT